MKRTLIGTRHRMMRLQGGQQFDGKRLRSLRLEQISESWGQMVMGFLIIDDPDDAVGIKTLKVHRGKMQGDIG